MEHKVILHDDTGFDMADSIRYTGFHYVDWHFDGDNDENIIMAVRTAYRGAVSYHNSNRMTYKVISKWREIVGNDMVIRHSKLPLKNLNPYVHTLNYSHHNIKYCFSKSARNIKQLYILYTSRV